MGLERIDGNSTPDDLNASWPLGTDTMDKGDDHIRGIKQVMKNFYNAYKTLMGVKGPYSGKFVRRWSGSSASVPNLWGKEKVYLIYIKGTGYDKGKYCTSVYFPKSGFSSVSKVGSFASYSLSDSGFSVTTGVVTEIWELTTGS